MNDTLYLLRARLRSGRGEALSAIAPALLRGSKGDTVGNAHRILWMLFQDRGEDEPRDFLWREEQPGHYLILSRREPANKDGLFEIATKEFAPQLRPGDRLAFALRANPVVSRKVPGKQERGVRCDIVMDALYEHEPTERAEKRDAATAEAAQSWMEGQGARHGFSLVPNPEKEGAAYLTATNYETVKIPRMNKNGKVEPRRRYAQFGVLDFEGLIEVTGPALFLAQLANGFGKAKAFGCGLMLIRRAG